MTERVINLLYEIFLKSITEQIEQFGNSEETDLVLLRNHLSMLIKDIEKSDEFKEQLAKCKD